MKANTKQLLLAITRFDHKIEPLSASLLKKIVAPDLTESGWRSLLAWCQQKGWIKLHQSGRSKLTVYALPQAQTILATVFPAFSSQWVAWRGDWSALIFLEAPSSDKGFRYLRRFCVEKQLMPMTRGVYLGPSWWLEKEFVSIAKLYKTATQLVQIKEFVSGPLNERIQQHYDVIGLSDIYSGISNQINDLLNKKDTQKTLKKQAISQISAILLQWSDVLALDLGVVRYYVPGAVVLPTLVEQWQHLLSSLDN